MDLIDQINKHNYLYLDKLNEINDLELEIWISEGRIDSDTKGNLQDIFESAPSIETNPIVSDEKCKRYKILFKNYLAFLVRNETFTTWNETDKYEGELFLRFKKSKFLDYIESSTATDYAKDFMNVKGHFHIGIICLNHIVDIAFLEEPVIEEVN